MFDIYQKWLGIPPEEQPPNHYRLLGIKQFESDLDVVASAADRQMGYVRSLQAGPNASLSQQLLNELARARLCLLDAEQKVRYDAVLKSAVPADSISAILPPAVGSSTSKNSPAIGETLGVYRLLERTSTGPAAWFYKAQDQRTGHLVTVKTLAPDAAKSDQVVKRFQREIELSTKLDHSNLIVGLDRGDQEGMPYLVLEYVVGTDLATVVKQHGPLPVEEAVEYIVQAARGLTQLHLLGVFHRNIKPQVLILDVRGGLKISDLLLARIAEDSSLADEKEVLTQMGQTMGSVDYMSPEQAEDAHQADARSDIYSLGCTLFFLLTGQPLYRSKSPMQQLLAHQKDPIPSLCAIRSDVPKSIDIAFRKMVAKDPVTRYQFMGDVIGDLETTQEKTFLARLLSRIWPSG